MKYNDTITNILELNNKKCNAKYLSVAFLYKTFVSY